MMTTMMSRNGCLVSLLLILSCSTLPAALGDRRRGAGLEYEVLRCIDQCDNRDVREYLLCQRDCELGYRERGGEEEEEEYGRRRIDPRWQPRPGRGGGGGERIPPERTPYSEYERCIQRCESEGPGGRGRQARWQQCEEQCEEVLRARERRRDWEREREILIGDDQSRPEDSNQRLEQCLSRCDRQPQGQQRQLCRFRCQQHHRQRGGAGKEVNYQEEEEEFGGWGRGRCENPYYFHAWRFLSQFRTEAGHIRVLEKFTRRSKLLKGIENYRFAILEANPNTFVIPHHSDADYVLFVLSGRATVSIVEQEKRDSHELQVGDVINVPAGAMAYLMNDNNEPIQIAKLVLPVNTPGSFQQYFPVGSEEPESYFWSFSGELLEAAFRTPRDQLERLFGQQRQGVIIRLQDEQLRDPSRDDGSSKKEKKEKKKGSEKKSSEEKGSHEKKSSEEKGSEKKRSEEKGSGSTKSKGPFNLLNEKPIYSNKFGRFFQASPEETKQLRDLGIAVTFADVKQGGMMLPHYNSRMTVLIFVQEGRGYIEMACPHLASEESQGRMWEEEEGQEIRGRYERVVSYLSPGDLFVVPAGHPFAVVATQNENFRMVGFGINALKNQRNFLAGKVNILNQIDREAKQLAFDAPGEEIDRVFSSQEESYFAQAPSESELREGSIEVSDKDKTSSGREPTGSILDFVRTSS